MGHDPIKKQPGILSTDAFSGVRTETSGICKVPEQKITDSCDESIGSEGGWIQFGISFRKFLPYISLLLSVAQVRRKKTWDFKLRRRCLAGSRHQKFRTIPEAMEVIDGSGCAQIDGRRSDPLMPPFLFGIGEVFDTCIQEPGEFVQEDSEPEVRWIRG